MCAVLDGAMKPDPTCGQAGCGILVVEPDVPSCRILSEIFGRDGGVVWCGSAAEGRGRLRAERVRLVVCADDLPDLPGLMLLAETREVSPMAPRILLCRNLDADFLLHAINQSGTYHYLPKPLDPEATERVVRHALDQNRLMEELVSARGRLDTGVVETRDRVTGREAVRRGMGVLVWAVLIAGLLAALVLLGLAGLYLVKAALGFDFLPDMHIRDYLP
jgi:DNA-binding NtrC family response regulator